MSNFVNAKKNPGALFNGIPPEKPGSLRYINGPASKSTCWFYAEKYWGKNNPFESASNALT